MPDQNVDVDLPSPAACRSRLSLDLRKLRDGGHHDGASKAYDFGELRAQPIRWDRVVKASHLVNCWYQRNCNHNLFITDGIVLREEQAAIYPPPNDAEVPDCNPRGCNKGACYAHRTYDPSRVKYPLKRIGARGEGRWQRISWEQAFAEIADQFIDVLTTTGPETIILGGGTQVHTTGSEGVGTNSFFEALGIPMSTQNQEIGDDHEGAALTFGKIVVSDSADNWFHADLLLIWSGNPAYTSIPNFHYITEARYKGTRVIAITPDYNPSSIHADLWVPVNIGTDGALALGMAQVIVRERLYNREFVREQTDLPLLVRTDTGKLLREKDLKRGGREDVFYFYDEASGQVVEAPRKTLALDGLVPALEGEYQVRTLQGTVRARSVFAVLRDRLDGRFTPEQVAPITGVPASLIEQLAREIATTRGVVNVPTVNCSKFYHGDLIERGMILVFALCGHMGRKGAAFNVWAMLTPDTGVGAIERQGQQLLRAIAANDPRYATWKEDGYTPEMIMTELAKDACAAGALSSTALVQFFHGGLLDLSARYQSWDPHLKRPLRQYVDEALSRGWQIVLPAPDQEPQILFQWGGNVFRRSRATKQMLRTMLPKLKLIVAVEWRMSTTALYADYVLPTCGWYERTSTHVFGSTVSPFMQINHKAVDPLYESLSEFTFIVRFARRMADRARARGILLFRDRNGKERRLDNLEERVTQGGLCCTGSKPNSGTCPANQPPGSEADRSPATQGRGNRGAGKTGHPGAANREADTRSYRAA